MARLKFDVTGVDPAGDFKVPKPGAYKAKIDVVEHKPSSAGNPMLEVQYVISEGEYEGSRIWDYYPLHVEWKWRRFLEAVGIVKDGKEKGELNTDNIVGKRVMIKTTIRPADEEKGFPERANVNNVTPLKGTVDEDEPDDAEDELDDEEEELDGEGDLTADDIRKMKKVELRDLLKENDVEGIRVTKQVDLDKLRERVVAKMVEEEMIAPEEEDEPEDEPDGDGDGEDIEEVEDYAELGVADLRNEAKERGLPTKGTKAALVKRLEKDDEEGEPF